MYDNKIAEIFTPPNSRCVTADYGIASTTNITVHNYGTNDKGVVSVIEGYAYSVNAEEPGQLLLHLDGVPAEAPYWVYALGPEVNDQYAYSVVSDDKKSTLYILARDVDTFNNLYNDEALAIVDKLGFTGPLSKPIPTYQEVDCIYDYKG